MLGRVAKLLPKPNLRFIPFKRKAQCNFDPRFMIFMQVDLENDHFEKERCLQLDARRIYYNLVHVLIDAIRFHRMGPLQQCGTRRLTQHRHRWNHTEVA